ncbi:MAG TPA: hypothetical protein VFK69_12445 [Candidatus Eisenbacteria bacterium]|nr:hypothetical protein [Candidatus Eisenbacteria bacterium]
MRKPIHADAELLIRLYELRQEPELRRARRWFLTEFKPAGWPEIQARYLSHSDEDRWMRQVVSYWEMVATIVNSGVLQAELFFEHTGEEIVAWERVKPWVHGARGSIRPTYLHQFERLVNDHLAYRAKQRAALERAAARGASSRPRARAARRAR